MRVWVNGTLLDDPKLRATMARAARARVMRRYSAAAFGDRVAEVLGGLGRVYPRDTGTQSNTRSATEKAY